MSNYKNPEIGDQVKITKSIRKMRINYPWIPDLSGNIGTISKIVEFDDGLSVYVKFTESFSIRRPLVGSGCMTPDDELGSVEHLDEWCFCWGESHEIEFLIL